MTILLNLNNLQKYLTTTLAILLPHTSIPKQQLILFLLRTQINGLVNFRCNTIFKNASGWLNVDQLPLL